MSGWPEVARRWADALGWILLSPDGRGNNHWDGLAEDDVFAALETLAAAVSLDRERIYLHGGSMGAHGALRLALRYPHRFAAVSAVAGWLSTEWFYPRWYAPPGDWELPPPIAPLLQAAAPAGWREHAGSVPGRLAYGDHDNVNEPEDTEWFLGWLRNRGWSGPHAWTSHRVYDGGHGAGGGWPEIYRFLRRHRRTWPARLHSLTLRCACCDWVTAERLVDPHQPADFDLTWRPGTAEVSTTNVAELSLNPSLGPPALQTRRCRLVVNGQTLELPRGGTARLDLAPAPVPYAKRRGLCGPIGELFRDPFQVIAPELGPDHDAALRFCADYNAWFILRWRDGDPPARDWWRPPYPYQPGAHVPAPPLLVRPEPPAAARPDRHLVVFGTPDTCALTRRFAEWPDLLPFRPLPDGLRCGETTWTGDRLGHLALHPCPWQPDRLLLLCHGYLNSRLEDSEVSPGWLGKDLESLPWQYPDLVVWDGGRKLRETVQPPLKSLPDAWLFAATLGPGWGWDGATSWRRDAVG